MVLGLHGDPPVGEEGRIPGVVLGQGRVRTGGVVQTTRAVHQLAGLAAGLLEVGKGQFYYQWQQMSTNSFLPTVFCQQFSANSFLPTVFCQQFSTNCFLPTIFYQQFSANSFLPTVFCQQFSTNSFLPTVFYQKFLKAVFATKNVSTNSFLSLVLYQ